MQSSPWVNNRSWEARTRSGDGWDDHHRDFAVVFGAVVHSGSTSNAKEGHIPEGPIIEVDGHSQGCQECIEGDLRASRTSQD